MKRRHPSIAAALFFVVAVITALFLTPAPHARAQDGGGGFGDPGSIFVSGFDLEFPGGTIGEYIRAVQKAAGHVNVVVSDEVKGLLAAEMPAVSLKGVSAPASLKLIGQRYVEVEGGYAFLKVGAITEGGSAPIHRVYSSFEPGHKYSQVQTRVFSMADLSEKNIQPDAVLTAVEVALTTADAIEAVQMQFHEETRLLIAHGEENYLNVIEQVLGAMREGVTLQQEDKVRQLEMVLADTHARLESLAVRLMERDVQRANAQQKAVEFQQRHDFAQRRIVELETNLASMEQMVRDRESMIRALQDEVDKSGGK